MPESSDSDLFSLDDIHAEIGSLQLSVDLAGSKIVSGLILATAAEIAGGKPSEAIIDDVIKKYRDVLRKVQAQNL